MQEAPSHLSILRRSVNLKKVCGIYAFIHRESGKCYVGQALDIHKRILRHLRECRNNPVCAIHRAIHGYGIDAFDIEVLEECEPQFLNDRERFYIVFLDSAGINGFNTKAHPSDYSRDTVSEATRQRHRASLIGRKKTDEHRAAMSASRIGMKLSDLHKKRIGMASLGKKRTPEQIERARLTHVGKKRSPESCLRMALAQSKHPILQLDKTDGSVIAKFLSCKEASIALGICHSGVKDAVRGKLKTSGGFRWIREADYLK